MPVVHFGSGVISFPLESFAFENSSAASMVAIAIQTLAAPRCIPGQILCMISVLFLPIKCMDLPASESEMANRERLTEPSLFFGDVSIWIEGIWVAVN